MADGLHIHIETILLGTAIPSAIINEKGDVLSSNTSFDKLLIKVKKLTGYTESNHLPFVRFLVEKHAIEKVDFAVICSEMVTTVELQIIIQSNLIHPKFQLSLVPLQEAGGEKKIWLQINEAADTEPIHYLNSIIGHLPTGALLFNVENNQAFANKSFVELMELPYEVSNGMVHFQLLEMCEKNSHFKTLITEFPDIYDGSITLNTTSKKKKHVKLIKGLHKVDERTVLNFINLLDETEINFTYNELKKSEQFFKSISKNFPHGAVGLINNRYEFLFFDGTQYPIPAIEAQDFLGKNVIEAFPAENQERIKLAIDRGLAGIGDEFELSSNGLIFIVNTVPIAHQQNKYTQVMMVIRDVTRIVKAEHEAELYSNYLKQIIDTDPNFIYVKNKHNEFLLANKALKDFFQIPEDTSLSNYGKVLAPFLISNQESERADKEVFTRQTTVSYEESIISPVSGQTHIFIVTKNPLKIGQQEPLLLGVAMDITSMRQAEHEIELQKDYLRQIIDTDPNIIFVKNPKGKFVLVNKAFADFYLSTPEEIIGKTDKDLGWGEDDLKHFEETDATVFRENRLVTVEEKVVNPKTKNTSYFLSTKKPMEFRKGEPLLLGVAVNITGRRIYEEKLKSSEALLQEVFEKAADALYLLDAESEEIVDCNQKAIALFGFDNKSDVKGPLSGLLLSKQLKADDVLYQLRKMDAKNFWNVEAEIMTPNGVTFWANMAATKFFLEGKAFYLLRISDISYQKLVENQIMQSLHEKEILIQEIHHRVKNNMAVISSLLQLQSGYITDPAMLEVFRDSQNRIKSMALIHEKLYQSSTLALIEFESYVKELARTILYSYNQTSTQILIDVHIHEIQLDINAAVPCGLIINELLSNACKHAFVGRSTGKIDIYFDKVGDNFVLKVKDDGVGLPSPDIIHTGRSLGMTLIQALTSQLNAHLEIQVNNGTTFVLTFKNKPRKNSL